MSPVAPMTFLGLIPTVILQAMVWVGAGHYLHLWAVPVLIGFHALGYFVVSVSGWWAFGPSRLYKNRAEMMKKDKYASVLITLIWLPVTLMFLDKGLMDRGKWPYRSWQSLDRK